jgi:hypothetical protein
VVCVNAARRSATEKRTQRHWWDTARGGAAVLYTARAASGRAVITFRRPGATRPCQSQLTCGPGHDAYPTVSCLARCGSGGGASTGSQRVGPDKAVSPSWREGEATPHTRAPAYPPSHWLGGARSGWVAVLDAWAGAQQERSGRELALPGITRLVFFYFAEYSLPPLGPVWMHGCHI